MHIDSLNTLFQKLITLHCLCMFAYTFLIIRTQERRTSKNFFETWKSKQFVYVQRHTGILTIINLVEYHNTHSIIYGMSNIENLSLVRKLTFYLQLDWFPLFYCLDIFYEKLGTKKDIRVVFCEKI